jgi:hypothetical protein
MERHHKTLKGNGVKPRLVAFTFFPDGSNTTALTTAAGTLDDPGGYVTQVARAAQGVFTVTLVDPIYRLAGKYASVQTAANNVDLYAQFGDVTHEGDGSPLTVDVRLKTGATSTDPPAANTNTSVSVMLWVEDSSAGGVA